MLLQIFLAILIGIVFGTLTGLIPGIHINLVGVFLVSLSATLLAGINPIYLVVFITAMAITHTFIDFIPSVFLGCPDTDTELSVLPGHELLKKGHGYQAILLTAYGSLAAIFALVLLAFPALLTMSKLYQLLTKNYVMPIVLITISFVLISLEKKKLNALFVFLLAGALGLTVLNLPGLNQPLLPLLTGLFGSSTLILSIKNKTRIPDQTIAKPKTKLFKPLFGSLIASPLCSFLPGLGSGQAAVIGNTISRNNRKGFLILLGATNTLVMGFSFLSLYAISKTRTGAAVAIKEIISLSPKILILIIAVSLFTGVASFFLTKFFAKFFSQKINKLNYTLLCFATLGVLSAIILIFSGFLGMLALIASTFTGIYSISLKVKRTNMMGCLLLPTILIYLI